MSGELILVVEDNDSLREGICEMLALEGYHVVEARNGIEAVKALHTSTPELILSDVMMPEMDGFDFYSKVRARSDLISIPFIFLTARTDPADLMKGRVLGADDYLAKPITRDELVTAIRSRLSRYSQVKIAQVHQAYQASLTLLAGAIESRGPNTYGHIERLTETALLLATYLQWKERGMNQLRFGAILHDIGKIYVPDEILIKRGPLTEGEWEEIKKHPGAGAEMVRGIPFLFEVAPLIRHHHENWNGSGYPDGMSGEAIPTGACILAVVDSFDAMVSERTYAKQLSLQEAHDEIVHLSGVRYDPSVVDCFEQAWGSARIQSLYKDA